ncbi:MAG: cytidine deaminase [Acutalibacteraceae bacterium]|nr:cytidine deaminase [Acutalibacteraceae bacterium]
MTDRELLELASQAREHAYAPYSHFRVGAALLCKDGTVYQGCNIENASFGATNCAERTAIFRAVYDGQREFSALAIVGAREGEPEMFCYPCGICRQVLSEFCPEDMRLVFRDSSGSIEHHTLGELFPKGFGGENL